MREIGTIPEEDRARRFVNYLLTLDIEARPEPGPGGSTIWVFKEDDLERARRELERFGDEPDNPRYLRAEQEARDRRRQVEQEENAHRKNTIDLRQRWEGPRRKPLTLALIALSVAASLATQFGSSGSRLFLALRISSYRLAQVDEENHAMILEHPGIDLSARWRDLAEIRQGQLWRLVTPIFLHFNLFHLIFDMFWLSDLGGLIEARRGSWRLGGLVLLAAVLSNLGEYFLTGNPGFGGMSGVVYALFGYIWMRSHYDPDSGLYLRPGTVPILLLWLVFCMTGAVGPIANVAHTVGLIVGMLAGAGPFVVGSFLQGWRGR